MNNINGKSNDLPLPEELFDYFSDDYDSETPTPKINTKNGKDNPISLHDTISELPPLESTIINTNDSVVNNNQVALPDIFFDNNESEESDFNESFNEDFDSTLEEVDLDDLLNETINSTNNNEDEYNRKTNNYTEDNTEVENIDIEDFFKSLETSNENNSEPITQNQEVTGVSLPDLLSDDYAEDESYHNEISRLDNNSTNNEIEDLDDFFKNLSEDNDDDNNDLDSYELDEGILDLLREPEEEDYNISEPQINMSSDLLQELSEDDYSQEYDDDTDAELSNILELLNNEEDYVEQEEPTSITDDLNPLEVEEYENNEPEYSHEETEQPQEPNKKLNKNKIKPRILLKPIISFYKFLERLGKLILEFLARIPIIGIPFKLLLNLLQKIPQVFSIVSSLFLPLLLVGLFIIINSIIYKTEQNILLPDEGSATFNNFNYDFESKTASGVITNTGNIIVESTPVIRVYSYKPNFNPISWLTYSLMGECVSESTITTDIDSITELSLPCAMNSTPNKIMKVVGSIE